MYRGASQVTLYQDNALATLGEDKPEINCRRSLTILRCWAGDQQALWRALSIQVSDIGAQSPECFCGR